RIERSRYLDEIIRDIGELELEKNEDELLEQEYETAKNSEKTIIALKSAVQAITGNDGANEIINSAEHDIAGFTDGIPVLNELYERLSAAEIELSDIASELEALSEKIELDSQRLEYLGERLGNINKLKRKYAQDCAGLRKLYDDACNEIMQLDSSLGEIEKLSSRKEELLRIVTEQARVLYDYREKTAEKFAERVTSELEFLNMAGVIIKVRHEKGKLTANGMDSVEFLISANKGEEPKPISKIASGGELSRIMLALKSVIADKDSVPTMIFDEIDTGVSGKAAQKIGIKLREIGRVRQVICVTHLSQIAVMADNHLMIEKKIIGDRTETNVTQLDLDGRISEIARIMSGENPSQLMIDNARAEIEKAANLQ
ncbi:MAG: DNA repair protein RecN, partial [Ruminococcus sp.]|nr:DNA repair protein RecN [Ruminococcus sp.]